MKYKKLIGALIASIIIIYLLFLTNAKEYLIKGVQSILVDFNYQINDELMVSVPKGWFVEYSYDTDKQARLYGIFNFDWDTNLVDKIDMAVNFTALGQSNDEVFVQRLKKQYRLSDSVYLKYPAKKYSNGMIAYVIEIEGDNPLYFPMENIMVYSDNSDIVEIFFNIKDK